MLVQKIHKTYGTHLECVIKYYSVLNILSSLELNPLSVKILAYASLKGNLMAEGNKEEACSTFLVPLSSFNNYMYRLVKRGFLVKQGKEILLAPQLHIEFDELLLQIHIDEK